MGGRRPRWGLPTTIIYNHIFKVNWPLYKSRYPQLLHTIGPSYSSRIRDRFCVIPKLQLLWD